jgi:sugar fermentation stimulation protein A
MEKETFIQIGALGNIRFSEGIYIYVGSAMNGKLISRIRRHTQPASMKKTHWHIDYLLACKDSRMFKIIIIPSQAKEECTLAETVKKTALFFIPHFGSTDCQCSSHLFYLGKDGEKITI